MVDFYALIKGSSEILVEVEILVHNSIRDSRLEIVKCPLSLVKSDIHELKTEVSETPLDFFFLDFLLSLVFFFDVTLLVLVLSLLSFGLLLF